MATNSLSPRTKFAKRHYEAIALAMQKLGPLLIAGSVAMHDQVPR